MFVSERRFILKTCGTTTLLLAIEPLLKLVIVECGLDSVWLCIQKFYNYVGFFFATVRAVCLYLRDGLF